MAYSPEHYQANKEKYSAKSKAWRVKNTARAQENRRRSYEENKERNLDYSTWYSLKRKFNLTKEEYQQKVELQGGVCAICSKECSRRLAVDHDHFTGKIRGLLCNSCNRGLGYLKDDVSTLQKAISYLQKFL